MYIINYDNETGKVTSIRRSDGADIPICTDNTDFQQFLEWNAKQKTPLDYETPIAVEPPAPVETLEEKITRIVKVEVATEVAKEISK